MKKYTLLGHVFELEDNAHHFLSRYIERIETYSRTNKVSQEVIDDIKYSIIEKLYRFQTPVTERQVMEVANSLGEPEVMFGDAEDETKETMGRSDNKRDWSIDKEKPMIRGVCYRLSKKLNVSVRYMRLAFIILAFIHGTGIGLYIIGALFVPFKDKKMTTGKIGSVLFEIVRIALWLFLLGILLPLTFGAMAGTALLFFTPAIDNQSFTAWIPQYMYSVGAAAVIALITLAFGALGALFKQRWISKSFALLASIIVIIAGIVTAGTVYKTTMLAVTHTKDINESFLLTGTTTGSGTIDISVGKLNSAKNNFRIPSTYSRVKLVPVSGNVVTIATVTTLRGISDAVLDTSAAKLSPLEVSHTGNSIAITRTSPVFSQEVPFAFMSTLITIGVPTNKEVSLSMGNAVDFDINNSFSERTADGTYRAGYCEDTMYIYDTAKNAFVCKNIHWYEGTWADDLDENGKMIHDDANPNISPYTDDETGSMTTETDTMTTGND